MDDKQIPMPKHPCQSCVYYKVCGESTRTEPCYGRMTKRERTQIVGSENFTCWDERYGGKEDGK